MKNLLHLFVAGAMLFASCSGTSTPKEQTSCQSDSTCKQESNNSDCHKKACYQSVEGKFAINFPGNPQIEKTEENPAKGLVLMMNQYTYQQNEKAFYIVSYTDYPQGSVSEDNAYDKCCERADAFVKTLGGNLEKTAKEKINKNKGCAFNTVVKDSLNVDMVLVFNGNRFYQYGVMYYNSEISSKEARKFIDSFEILK